MLSRSTSTSQVSSQNPKKHMVHVEVVSKNNLCWICRTYSLVLSLYDLNVLFWFSHPWTKNQWQSHHYINQWNCARWYKIEIASINNGFVLWMCLLNDVWVLWSCQNCCPGGHPHHMYFRNIQKKHMVHIKFVSKNNLCLIRRTFRVVHRCYLLIMLVWLRHPWTNKKKTNDQATVHIRPRDFYLWYYVCWYATEIAWIDNVFVLYICLLNDVCVLWCWNNEKSEERFLFVRTDMVWWWVAS